MSKKMIVIFLVFAVASMACGVTVDVPIKTDTVGAEVTDILNIDPPVSGQTTELMIDFGAGNLNLGPGAGAKLLTGTALYNVEDLKPAVEISGNKVSLEQGNYQLTVFPNLKGLKNEWDLMLGDAPIELTINAGAYQGDFEFGSLALTALTIKDGASNVTVAFSELNTAEMAVMRYDTGASSVTMNGLANANFSTLIFNGGAGDYRFDFSGKLQRSATVMVNTGVSNMIIVVPDGVSALVTINGGLSNVELKSGWVRDGDKIIREGVGPTLTFVIDIGAGNLTLR